MLELGDFLLFASVAIGLTHIMVDSVIMQPVRDWIKAQATKHDEQHEALTASPAEIKTVWFWGKVNQLLGCYQCAGFWCGAVAGAITISYHPVDMLACGLAGSFLSLLAAQLLNYLEAKAVIEIPKNGN